MIRESSGSGERFCIRARLSAVPIPGAELIPASAAAGAPKQRLEAVVSWPFFAASLKAMP
jgi:hypothetical protein